MSIKAIAAETLDRLSPMRKAGIEHTLEQDLNALNGALNAGLNVPPPKPSKSGVSSVFNCSMYIGVEQLNTPPLWREALARIDPSRPPEGTPATRWRQLITDARWLAQTHGEAVHALGWHTSALFGLTRYDGEGGLADRLAGARSVRFTDGAAHWRRVDGDEALTGMLIRRSMRDDMPPLWEWCP